MKSNNLDKITVLEDPDSNCSKLSEFIGLNTAILHRGALFFNYIVWIG